MTKKHVSLLVVFVLLFTTLFSSFVFAADKEEWVVADEITINAKAHVQSFGDQTYEPGKGMIAFGTEGKAKRLENFNLTLEGAPADMELVGMAHVQSFGDMPKEGFKAGEVGTKGLAKRIEGVAFKLVKKGTDTLYPGYRVAYAVHMQSFGWGISKDVNEVVTKNFDGAEDFAFDGTFAGTKGLSKRIESVSLIIYKEAKLAVKSVTADNLKQVVVEFNQAVDTETVVDGNFKLAAKGGSSVSTTAVLDEGNRTVVLTVKDAGAGLTNQGKYVLTVDKVKSVAGKTIDKAEIEFTAFDANLPKVEDIKVTGPRSLIIVFSEPIKKNGVVEVKSGNSTISVDSSFTGYNTNEIAVSLYSTLADGKVYDITVKEFEDFAGYNNIITTVNLPYAKNVNAPVATIEKVEQEYVVVAFDKPVKGLSKDNFYHTFSAWKPVGIYTDAEFKNEITSVNTSVSKVYVQFYKSGVDASRPIPEGTTYLTILGKVGGVEIKDNWSNALGTQELKISVAADKTKPEVTKVEVKSETSLTVDFNKNVNFEKADVEILDENGKAISGLRISAVEKVDNSSKKYTVTFSKNLAGKTVIVNIEGVEDLTLAANKLVPFSTTIEITDKTAPVAERATVEKVTDKNALYVFFSESVDADTALVSGNYYLVNGTTYTRLSKATSFFGGDKTVKITLTNDEAKLVSTGTTPTALFVTGVEDLAGNMLKAGYVSAIGLNTDTTNVPKMTKAEATDVSTVKVTFDQELSKVDLSAFQVNGTTPAAIDVTLSGNKTVVTLTLRNDLPSDVNVTTDSAFVVIVNNTKIANAFNANPEANESIAIVDKIVPEINTTTAGALVVERTSANKIEIEFNEKIDIKSLSRLTFKVENANVSEITVDSNTRVVLTITDFADMDEIRVTQQYDITDLKGNVFKADDVLEGVDKTAK